jgi:hypothetical protein
MRASIRRIFPQRQASGDDRRDSLRVSLYEDAIPRVLPTTGLRPLHGTVPEHLLRQASQHQRSKSMPATNAVEAERNVPATAQFYGETPPAPISKDWATPNQNGEASSRTGHTRTSANDRSWPLSRDGSQMGHPVSEFHPNDRQHGSASESSTSRSARRMNSGLSHNTSQAHGPRPSHEGGSSHVGSLGAMYGEDVADRNIAERQRGYDMNGASRPATSGQVEGIGNHSSFENDSRGRPRRQSPYSHAQIDGSAEDEVQQPAEEKVRTPRRKWTVSRKPVGSGPADSALYTGSKGLDQGLEPQQSDPTNRNSFRTIEPVNTRGKYNNQKNMQDVLGAPNRNTQQPLDPNTDPNQPRHLSSQGTSHSSTSHSKHHSTTDVDELERRLGTMGVVDLNNSKETTVHETIAPGKLQLFNSKSI